MNQHIYERIQAVAVAVVLLVIFLACFISREETNSAPPVGSIERWFDYDTNGVAFDFTRSTNFLTIEDCVYVSFGGNVIVRVTDAQWELITTHYREYLRTNDLQFNR